LPLFTFLPTYRVSSFLCVTSPSPPLVMHPWIPMTQIAILQLFFDYFSSPFPLLSCFLRSLNFYLWSPNFFLDPFNFLTRSTSPIHLQIQGTPFAVFPFFSLGFFFTDFTGGIICSFSPSLSSLRALSVVLPPFFYFFPPSEPSSARRIGFHGGKGVDYLIFFSPLATLVPPSLLPLENLSVPYFLFPIALTFVIIPVTTPNLRLSVESARSFFPSPLLIWHYFLTVVCSPQSSLFFSLSLPSSCSVHLTFPSFSFFVHTGTSVRHTFPLSFIGGLPYTPLVPSSRGLFFSWLS